MHDLINKAKSGLFDSHCHLNDSSFDIDRDRVVADAVEAGVELIIDVAESLRSSKLAVNNAKKYPGVVFAAVGVDPHVFIPRGDEYFRADLLDVKNLEAELKGIEELISNNSEQVVMIGETGLDDYWYQEMLKGGELSVARMRELQQKQEELFRWHLQLAATHKLPLTIHSRGVEQRCLDIAKEYEVTGIFHSYTGDLVTARQILAAGFGLGLNGIYTFKKSQEIRDIYNEILGKVDSDWSALDFYNKGVYFETDAPYLSPEGKRGERNQPANIASIFNQIFYFEGK